MFYFGNMDGGNSKCGDGDSMAIITSAAFGSSVALAEATWARSSGVHKGLPSDQLPRHLSYHWADESKRSKSFAESKPSAFSHFRSASLSVSHSLSLSRAKLGSHIFVQADTTKNCIIQNQSVGFSWFFHVLFWENFDPSLSQPGSPGSLAWGFRIFSSRTRSPPASRTSSTLAAEISICWNHVALKMPVDLIIFWKKKHMQPWRIWMFYLEFPSKHNALKSQKSIGERWLKIVKGIYCIYNNIITHINSWSPTLAITAISCPRRSKNRRDLAQARLRGCPQQPGDATQISADHYYLGVTGNKP